jgi:hypothetical protein
VLAEAQAGNITQIATVMTVQDEEKTTLVDKKDAEFAEATHSLEERHRAALLEVALEYEDGQRKIQEHNERCQIQSEVDEEAVQVLFRAEHADEKKQLENALKDLQVKWETHCATLEKELQAQKQATSEKERVAVAGADAMRNPLEHLKSEVDKKQAEIASNEVAAVEALSKARQEAQHEIETINEKHAKEMLKKDREHSAEMQAAVEAMEEAGVSLAHSETATQAKQTELAVALCGLEESKMQSHSLESAIKDQRKSFERKLHAALVEKDNSHKAQVHTLLEAKQEEERHSLELAILKLKHEHEANLAARLRAKEEEEASKRSQALHDKEQEHQADLAATLRAKEECVLKFRQMMLDKDEQLKLLQGKELQAARSFRQTLQEKSQEYEFELAAAQRALEDVERKLCQVRYCLSRLTVGLPCVCLLRPFSIAATIAWHHLVLLISNFATTAITTCFSLFAESTREGPTLQRIASTSSSSHLETAEATV